MAKPFVLADPTPRQPQQPVIDLGDEPTHEIQFKLGGVVFSVFPLDEIEIISQLASADEATGKPEATGEAFWQICQDRLAKHDVRASLIKSGEWYTALFKAYEDQLRFFDQSPASSGSMDSAKTGGEPINSVETSDGCSPPSAAASKRKSRRKTS